MTKQQIDYRFRKIGLILSILIGITLRVLPYCSPYWYGKLPALISLVDLLLAFIFAAGVVVHPLCGKNIIFNVKQQIPAEEEKPLSASEIAVEVKKEDPIKDLLRAEFRRECEIHFDQLFTTAPSSDKRRQLVASFYAKRKRFWETLLPYTELSCIEDEEHKRWE